jgi:hypothetical protein
MPLVCLTTNHITSEEHIRVLFIVLCVAQMEKGRRDELAREKDALQGQVAELGGMVKSQERLLELEKVRSSSAAAAACSSGSVACQQM